MRTAAEAGNTAAQFRLANEYFYGSRTRKKNYTLAAHWYLTVANKNVPEGMFNYALCLDQGLGVERNPFLAAEYYRKAAETKTLPYAMFNYALLLRKGIVCRSREEEKRRPQNFNFEKDEAKSNLLLEELIQRGFAPAMTEMAEILFHKKERSPEETDRIFTLLYRASKDSAAPAKTFRYLSDCYFNGIGTRPDGVRMIECLERAVHKGDAMSMLKLAYCLESGVYVDLNEKRALELYQRAAKYGHGEALFKVGKAIAENRIKNISPVQAMEYYKRAAEKNHAEAWYRLGEILEQGNEKVKADIVSARNAYFQSARLGYPRAQYRVGLFFLGEEEQTAVKDFTAAVYWFRQGAERGDGPSMRGLAHCLYHGKGCDADRSLGMYWLKRAAQEGDLRAMEMIRNRQIP
ncbi:MAG: sel1 repeat family protein [Lentisphaeria bacterium]|nr:sel1 repeat family protein [Lentisphaeria bacterium]